MPDELNPWSWSDHTLDVLTAIGTVGAVIVAVLGAAIYWVGTWVVDLFKRPRLGVDFDADRNVASETVATRPSGVKLERRLAAFLRLDVRNTSGARAAEGVEVIVSEVRSSGRAARFGALGWTNTEPTEVALGPNVTRTVDLGWIVADPSDHSFHLGLKVQPISGQEAPAWLAQDQTRRSCPERRRLALGVNTHPRRSLGRARRSPQSCARR